MGRYGNYFKIMSNGQLTMRNEQLIMNNRLNYQLSTINYIVSIRIIAINQTYLTIGGIIWLNYNVNKYIA
jgi:hypothetical protein